MPRKARMYMAGMPCHIIPRGNNRDACFYADQDYQFYIDCMQDACERYHVAVHAYVLMTNHLHLLMSPENVDGISRVMQSVERRYVQYINLVEYRRSGTLWEGRHKASLVDADNYLLICIRYIELNPVRAGMVEHPASYRWPSFRFDAREQRLDY
jgi:putative transposase